MRDPKRINAVLAQLERLWKKHPDMRFFQLVDYLKESQEDAYYVEDDMVFERINKKLEE